MEETQKLYSEVIALRSSVGVEASEYDLWLRTRAPRVLAPEPDGSGRQYERLSDHVKGSGSWDERAQRGLTDQGSGCSVNDGANLLLYG